MVLFMVPLAQTSIANSNDNTIEFSTIKNPYPKKVTINHHHLLTELDLSDQRKTNPWIHSCKHDQADSPSALWQMADNEYNSHNKWHEHYKNLTPEQKEHIKKRREAFKNLPPEERERIQQARKKFHSLPPEERQQLKERWRKMSPEERTKVREKI